MKIKEPSYCVGISVSLPMSIVNKIDEKRKSTNVSRSSFIRELIINTIGNCEGLNNDN